jgi:hypothetical protein
MTGGAADGSSPPEDPVKIRYHADVVAATVAAACQRQATQNMAYRLVYLWELEPIPKHWTIDHARGEKDGVCAVADRAERNPTVRSNGTPEIAEQAGDGRSEDDQARDRQDGH